MRHRKKKITLDRESSHRLALMKNLATSLVLHEKLTTTEAKARALRSVVERLITRSKQTNLTSRRQAHQQLLTEGAVKKVMEVLGPRYRDRRGGYTRVIHAGVRRGDAARMAVIELV